MIQEMKGNWDDIKQKLKEKYLILTDQDLKLGRGTYDDMLAKLEIILGKPKAEMHTWICGLN
jgi:hypothetical protein